MRRTVLLVLLLPLLLVACDGGGRFSPEAWAQTDPMERSTLTHDLISRRVLIGKQYQEVMRMLGGPRTYSSDSATWFIGVDEQGQPMVLQVDFENRTAIRARIHRE